VIFTTRIKNSVSAKENYLRGFEIDRKGRASRGKQKDGMVCAG
jgi:hypothetical protein